MSVLVRTAEELACGKITIEEGGRRARQSTGSQTTNIAGVPTNAIPSGRDVEQELAALAAYLNERDYTQLERWAGAYVMVQAYLGLGGLSAAADLVRRVAVTRPLPEGAPRLVSAMIDAVLADAETASPALVDQLLALRRSLAGSSKSDPGRVIETITGCFDREGWQYYADRDAHKILIQFSFPYGETRLVCSASADDRLTIVALTVVQFEPHHQREIEDVLRRFVGVRAEFDDNDKTVTLHYTLPAAASLTRYEIRNAVVHVNGAAEQVIMRIRQLRR